MTYLPAQSQCLGLPSLDREFFHRLPPTPFAPPSFSQLDYARMWWKQSVFRTQKRGRGIDALCFVSSKTSFSRAGPATFPDWSFFFFFPSVSQ
jgi:hypothetical protein